MSASADVAGAMHELETRPHRRGLMALAREWADMAATLKAYAEHCVWIGKYGMEALRRWDAAQPGPPREIDRENPDDCLRMACGPLGLSVDEARDSSLPALEYLAKMWVERENYEEMKATRTRRPRGARQDPTVGEILDDALLAEMARYLQDEKKPSIAGLARHLRIPREGIYRLPKYRAVRDAWEKIKRERERRGRTLRDAGRRRERNGNR
jgi:hypothetical protein